MLSSSTHAGTSSFFYFINSAEYFSIIDVITSLLFNNSSSAATTNVSVLRDCVRPRMLAAGRSSSLIAQGDLQREIVPQDRPAALLRGQIPKGVPELQVVHLQPKCKAPIRTLSHAFLMSEQSKTPGPSDGGWSSLSFWRRTPRGPPADQDMCPAQMMPPPPSKHKS